MNHTVPINADFGTILNCAVRYAIGRRTYMPGLVIAYITPLLPSLDDKTLSIFDRDIAEHEAMGDLGDPIIDAPGWKNFHAAVQQELTSRNQYV